MTGTTLAALGGGGEGGGEVSRRAASTIRRLALTLDARGALPFVGRGGATTGGGATAPLVELDEEVEAAFLAVGVGVDRGGGPGRGNLRAEMTVEAVSRLGRLGSTTGPPSFVSGTRFREPTGRPRFFEGGFDPFGVAAIEGGKGRGGGTGGGGSIAKGRRRWEGGKGGRGWEVESESYATLNSFEAGSSFNGGKKLPQRKEKSFMTASKLQQVYSKLPKDLESPTSPPTKDSLLLSCLLLLPLMAASKFLGNLPPRPSKPTTGSALSSEGELGTIEKENQLDVSREKPKRRQKEREKKKKNKERLSSRPSTSNESTLKLLNPSEISPLPSICFNKPCLISAEMAAFFSLSMICTRALKRPRTGRWSDVRSPARA